MAEAAGWVQALRYRIVSAAFHQPRLLRALARLARRFGRLSSTLRVVASAEGVRDVLAREANFSHGQYPALMIDGPFLIGLPSGPGHTSKRQCLHALLPTPQEMAAGTQAALRPIVERLRSKDRFDLIEDYMAPLVWQAIHLAYDPGDTRAFAMELERMLAARWLGAQLMIGSVATPAVRQRALRSAALLDATFAGPDNPLDPRWQARICNAAERARDAIGLLWVGHPATTQAGALMMQELLCRPAVYRRLHKEFGDPEEAAQPHARKRLREHVLELLRFRPPFPLLGRLVPSPTGYCFGSARSKGVAEVEPGTLGVLTIGALFDPEAQREDPTEYLPGRHFHREEDALLMFGAGPRHCIAREQVIEILVTALAGLLQLGELRAPRRGARVYDGPVIVKMPLFRH